MKMDYNRKIVLEDGSEYEGYGFGDMCDKVCEIVFNTSMVGYQEIISDPSYTYQAVVMTYPLIGNYGICDDDFETKTPSIGALIVREYNDEPSNFRCTQSLAETMKKYEIPGIYGVDTRQIARSIRDLGSRKVLITGIETSRDDALRILERTDIPKDAVKTVSPKEILFYPVPNPKHHIVCVDCGMKKNILRSFNKKGISVSVVPHDTSDSVIESLNPDGVFISNGPGDPEDVPKTIETIKKLIGKYPMFGICLGHQIISLACGAKTYKLKFGHRGGNHSVKNLKTNKIEITSQNHSYAVDADSLRGTCLEITHINLLDNTVEGVESRKDKVFSVQYHPESAPGPQDSTYLFDEFIKLMEGGEQNA